MSAELLARCFASTRGVLANVTPEQLGGPETPCASWNVRELVDHIVNGTTWFATIAETGTPPGEDVFPAFNADNVVEVFDAGSDRAVQAFAADGAMERIMHLPFGDLPGAAFVYIACGDTFTHGWDLAKATGQSTDLDPATAAELLEIVSPMLPDAFRGDEGQAPFGPRQDAPAGATAADKMAAFMGRPI
jgi:uncharacterized protein (TIGR03086 family)